MHSLIYPRMPLSPTAAAALQTLCRELGAREQFASESLTAPSKDPRMEAHAAEQRFLEELEFIHASHARALLEHAGGFSPAENTAPVSGTLAPPRVSGPSPEPEDVMIFEYTQLNLLAAHYTRLYTLGTALGHGQTTQLALRHLKALTPKIMECSQSLPLLTAGIAAERFGRIAPGCAKTALAATQAAWKNDTTFPPEE